MDTSKHTAVHCACTPLCTVHATSMSKWSSGLLQEEIRLAHVAFTRAKDRLYVTSHRIAEGSADASSLEAAIASDTRAVKRVDPSKFIPLLDSSEAMTRTCHPIDAVEEYLGRCATQNDMRQGGATFSLLHLANLSVHQTTNLDIVSAQTSPNMFRYPAFG